MKTLKDTAQRERHKSIQTESLIDTAPRERREFGTAIDWGDAPPAMDKIFGRADEAEKMVVAHNSGVNVYCLVGSGGIGKSTLARNWADKYKDQYDAISWVSFKNKPDLKKVFRKINQLLSPQLTIPESDVDEQIERLVRKLAEKKAVVIFDNMETVMATGNDTGRFIDGYSEIEGFLNRFVDYDSSSIIVLTTREKPNCIERLAQNNQSKCSYTILKGLSFEATKQLVESKQVIYASDESIQKFRDRYEGSPYALILVISIVKERYNGNLDNYLKDESQLPSGITGILDEQLGRLNQLQLFVIYRLAVERIPVSIRDLYEAFDFAYNKRDIDDAVDMLSQKCLLEPPVDGYKYFIQNVLLEHSSEMLCEVIRDEVGELLNGDTESMVNGDWLRKSVMRAVPILIAMASREIREAQLNTIVKPIIALLRNKFGAIDADKFISIVRMFPNTPQTGYSAGTLINLLVHNSCNLCGKDLSDTCLRSCDFEHTDLIDTDLTSSDLRFSRFREVMSAVSAITFTNNCGELFFGTADGYVHYQNIFTGEHASQKIHNGYVRDIAYNEKDRLVISAGEDGYLHFLNAETLDRRFSKNYNGKSLRFIDIYSDGEKILCGGEGGLISLLDNNLKPVFEEANVEEGIIRDGCFLPDGRIAYVNEKGGIIIRSLTDIEDKNKIQLKDKSLWCLCLDGDNLLVSGKSGEIYCFSTQLNLKDTDFDSAGSPIWKIVSSDNHYIAATSEGVLLFYNKNNGKIEYRIVAHSKWIRSLAIDSKSELISSGGDDQSIRVYDVAKRELVFDLEGQLLNLITAAYSRGYVLAGGTDGMLHCWTRGDDRDARIRRNNNAWIRTVASSDHSDTVVIGYSTGLIETWDKESFKTVCKVAGGDIWDTDFHPTEQKFLAATEDGNILEWTCDSNGFWSSESVYKFDRWAISCKYSHNGKYIACGDGLGNIAIISGEKTIELERQPQADQAWGLAWGDNDQTIFASERSGKIRIWKNIFSGNPECKTVDSKRANWSAMYSPKSETLITCGDAGCVFFIKNLSGDPAIVEKGVTKSRLQSVVPGGENTFFVVGYEGVVVELNENGEVIHQYIPDKQYSRLKMKNAKALTCVQISSLTQLGADNN